MKRLLLVTHRPIQEQGGLGARWRSLMRHLPELGWSVEPVSAPPPRGGDEFAHNPRGRRRGARRARVMGGLGRATAPAFGILGLRPEALPPSMLWAPRGAVEVRRRLRAGRYDAVLATGPPMAGPVAARAARQEGAPPFVAEMRDLCAGNPHYDAGGRALRSIEGWVLGGAQAVVACTPEAVADLRHRHPRLAERIVEVPNGFEPELLQRRRSESDGHPTAIIHSGTLTADRPLTPLLRLLRQPPYRERFRLVLHGYLAPASAREVTPLDGHVEVVAPSTWEDAVRRVTEADVALVTQARSAGDATAVAAKVYEYLALGKPVLCLTHGGATEALLRRLGADRFCARLDDEQSIRAALDRLTAPAPAAVAPERLATYDRRRLAARMVEVLDGLASVAAR